MCECQLAQPESAAVVQGVVVRGDVVDLDYEAGAAAGVLPSFAAAGGIALVGVVDIDDFAAADDFVFVRDLAADPMKPAVGVAGQGPLQRHLRERPVAILQLAGSILPHRVVRDIAPLLAGVSIPAAVEARDWIDRAELAE